MFRPVACDVQRHTALRAGGSRGVGVCLSRADTGASLRDTEGSSDPALTLLTVLLGPVPHRPT